MGTDPRSRLVRSRWSVPRLLLVRGRPIRVVLLLFRRSLVYRRRFGSRRLAHPHHCLGVPFGIVSAGDERVLVHLLDCLPLRERRVPSSGSNRLARPPGLRGTGRNMPVGLLHPVTRVVLLLVEKDIGSWVSAFVYESYGGILHPT